MRFIYPAFLFALLTLAIPVIIHLFNFRKFQKVNFSNVQFLKEIQEQQASRRNLKERLILAARLLALFFLVLAFARPYLPGQNSGNTGRQNAVSIFVDNSYTMETLNREGSLLDDAKQKAKEIASAYNINDRFQLLTQDFEGKHQRLLSRDEFNDAVDQVKISAQSRTLQQIINRQQNLLLVNLELVHKNPGQIAFLLVSNCRVVGNSLHRFIYSGLLLAVELFNCLRESRGDQNFKHCHSPNWYGVSIPAFAS